MRKKRRRRKSGKNLRRKLKNSIFLHYNPFYDIFLIRISDFVRNQISF